MLTNCLVTVIFFFNDTATTEIYTLSLHDALPISVGVVGRARIEDHGRWVAGGAYHTAEFDAGAARQPVDRKSTRLNSSHANISYAVFCLKKKRTKQPYNW